MRKLELRRLSEDRTFPEMPASEQASVASTSPVPVDENAALRRRAKRLGLVLMIASSLAMIAVLGLAVMLVQRLL